MKRAILLAAVCAVASAATAGQAQAGMITVTFSTTLHLTSGADTGGLDGATLQIYAEFDDAAVYQNTFGSPAINALAHSITISSASEPSSNVSFSSPSGLAYYPTFANGFFTSSGLFLSGGPLSQIVMETGPGAVVPTMGDTISLSHFNTTDFDPRNLRVIGTDGSQYDWSSEASLDIGTISAVPEPSSLALLGIGVCALGAARRRRQSVERQTSG